MHPLSKTTLCLYAIMISHTCMIVAKTGQQQTLFISEKCYQNWQNINKDCALLAYYFEGAFNGMAERNDPDYKPSDVLKHFRDDKEASQFINKATNLSYMPATRYLWTFISDENYNKLDAAFTEKYNETQDIAATWNWFNNHFREHALQKPISDFCNDMMQHDAARIVLEQQGITFKDQGRTLVLDGSRMSEKAEDMETVRNAFETIYKK